MQQTKFRNASLPNYGIRLSFFESEITTKVVQFWTTFVPLFKKNNFAKNLYSRANALFWSVRRLFDISIEIPPVYASMRFLSARPFSAGLYEPKRQHGDFLLWMLSLLRHCVLTPVLSVMLAIA
jgi:hypothetical protein